MGGHQHHDCLLTERGEVFHVAGPLTPSLSPRGTHSGKVVRGIHQAIVDSGCTQTLVHQTLVWPGALLKVEWVEVKYMHGDIHKYPTVLPDKKRSGKAVVMSCLTHPLILGTDWPWFKNLLGQCVGMHS